MIWWWVGACCGGLATLVGVCWCAWRMRQQERHLHLTSNGDCNGDKRMRDIACERMRNVKGARRVNVAPLQLPSESNFMIRFLLEIPLWGEPLFKWNSLKPTEYLNTQRILFVKGFHLKRKAPQGDIKQEPYRKHPVLSRREPRASSAPNHPKKHQQFED